MKVLYILYQFLIGWPLVIVATLFTAIFTIICFPWKNGKEISLFPCSNSAHY